MDRFDTVSPLDYRYYGDNPAFFARLKTYVSAGADVRYLLRVELALARMLGRWGVCPPGVADEIETAIKEIAPGEVYEEEARVQHNIRALVNTIRRHIGPAARPYVHLFATSADIMDTAAALRYKELVRDVLLPDLIELQRILIGSSRETAHEVQIGRTHGQHAVPTTFGYALALYVSRLGSRIQLLDRAHRNLRGKFSGAVGAFNALSLFDATGPARREVELLAELGLQPSDTSVSSQIVEPEFVADLAYAVTSCFSVLANLADDMRHLIRSEIGEVAQIYGEAQVGSSTMPHKMNPKDFENVKSLWKEFMPRLTTVFLDQISEHQRDLTNSASSRFLPELFTGFAYGILRMKDALEKVRPNPSRMREHLEKGAQYCVAEPLYISLGLAGLPDAYDRVMKLSRESRRTGAGLLDLARQDPEIAGFLDGLPLYQKQVLEDPARYIGDAPGRAIATCDHWERAAQELQGKLAAEREEARARWEAKPAAAR